MEKINKLSIFILGLIFIFLNGCQNIKENLSLKKKANTDEFLVQKKNPLILPPDYQDLPKPMDQKRKRILKNKDIDFSKVFSETDGDSSLKTLDIEKSLEDSIRKKIENK